MKNFKITPEFAQRFTKSYAYKMGGTQTVVFPNGEKFYFDDRKYYSGRGQKYNSSIKHEYIGDVIVSKEELKQAIRTEKERAKRLKQRIKENKERVKRLKEAEKQGIYLLKETEYGTFVELSDEERMGRFFDAQRLANTLKIKLEDAQLLNSIGKTYVFAQSETGVVYELYHSCLDWNDLNISVSVATPERIAEFNPAEWQSAPYAYLYGQTARANHFVC